MADDRHRFSSCICRAPRSNPECERSEISNEGTVLDSIRHEIQTCFIQVQAASSDISNVLSVNATVSHARVALNKAATALPSAVETLVNSAVNENPAKTANEVKSRLGPGFGAWKGKNVVVFLTDQESPLLNVPPGWEEANLPGLTRLKKNGLEFKRAYTNAAMCTSARATIFTGFLTTQHNARYVLEENLPNDLNPQINTPAELPGLAKAAEAAGYEVVYKGKLHLTKPENSDYTVREIDRVGSGEGGCGGKGKELGYKTAFSASL